MTDIHWAHALRSLSPDVKLFPPAFDELILNAERVVGALPDELREFLKASNGLTYRSFRVFSIFDPARPKKTWESLQRANEPAQTGALGGDAELLSMFLVFADIGSGLRGVPRNFRTDCLCDYAASSAVCASSKFIGDWLPAAEWRRFAL